MDSPSGRTGGADVRSHLSSHPQEERGGLANEAGDRAGEIAEEARQRGKETLHAATDRMDGVKEEARSRGADTMRKARNRADEAIDRVQGRASEMSGRARERISEATHSVEDQLEEYGVLQAIEDNPMIAVGAAFSVGFLLGGSGNGGRGRSERGKKSPGMMGKAGDQIAGAVMGSVSAALTQQLRTMVEEGGGISGIVDAFTGGGGSEGGRGRRAGGDRSRERSRIITETNTSDLGTRPG